MPTQPTPNLLPDPIPQHTWIAYSMIDRGKGWSILEQRVCHSIAQMTVAVAGEWIEVVPKERRGTATRSVLVYYGVQGAVIEPIEQLAKVMNSFDRPGSAGPVLEGGVSDLL